MENVMTEQTWAKQMQQSLQRIVSRPVLLEDLPSAIQEISSVSGDLKRNACILGMPQVSMLGQRLETYISHVSRDTTVSQLADREKSLIYSIFLELYRYFSLLARGYTPEPLAADLMRRISNYSNLRSKRRVDRLRSRAGSSGELEVVSETLI